MMYIALPLLGRTTLIYRQLRSAHGSDQCLLKYGARLEIWQGLELILLNYLLSTNSEGIRVYQFGIYLSSPAFPLSLPQTIF